MTLQTSPTPTPPPSSSMRKRQSENIDLFSPIQKAIFHLGDKHPTMTLEEDIQRTSEIILSSFDSHADSIVECCTSCIIELPHKISFLCSLLVKVSEAKPGLPEQVIRESFSFLKMSLSTKVSWRHSSQILRFFSLCLSNNLLSSSSLECLIKSILRFASNEREIIYTTYLSKLTPFGAEKRIEDDNLPLPSVVLEMMFKFSSPSLSPIKNDSSFSFEMLIDVLVVDPCWDEDFSLQNILFSPSPSPLFKPFSLPEDQFFIIYDIRHLIEGMECNHRKCADIILNGGCDPSLLERTLLDGDDKGRIVAHLLLGELMRNRRNGLNEIVYETLLLDCCRLSPNFPRSLAQTLNLIMENAMYNLDHTSIDRLANWFSLHLSNFDFKWNWDKWSCYLENSSSNQILFIRLVLKGILNLSYRDRIIGTIPESFRLLLPPTEEINFSLNDDIKNQKVNSITKIIFDKGSGDDILKICDNESDDYILISCILKFGSKSRTYMLVVIEKYLSLLKVVESRSPFMILNVMNSFWGDFGDSCAGMTEFVIEKLISYRIIMPICVIEWFIKSGKSLSYNRSLIMGTLRQSYMIPLMAEEKMKVGKLSEEKIIATVTTLKKEFYLCLQTFNEYLLASPPSPSIEAFKKECEFAFS